MKQIHKVLKNTSNLLYTFQIINFKAKINFANVIILLYADQIENRYMKPNNL